MHQSADIIGFTGSTAWRTCRVAAATLLLGLGATALAQDREETGEFGIQINQLGGEAFTGTNGSTLDVSNDTAIGIVGAYNFTSRFSLGGEISWADPGYNLNRVTQSGNVQVNISGDMDVTSFLLKGTFNFLEGAFTPYVEAGAGWLYIDSNVVSDSSTGCWWDYWYGYVCAEWYDTYSDTRTGYTYAAGVRWDLTDEFGLKASYGRIEADTNRTNEDISLDALRFEFVWMF